MGLDAVELVMDVEDHFGITVRDTDAEVLRTVGDLVSLIQSRLVAARQEVCPTLPAFLHLRSCVRDISGDERFRIRPRERVADSLSSSQRRALWRRLSSLLGSRPRELQRPRWLRIILVAALLILLASATVLALAIDVAILPVTLAAAAIAAFVLHLVTLPFRTTPPDDWTTFGDIARKLAGVVAATKRTTLETADDILTELRPLIVESLGVDADEVVSDARFVEDLGIG
jgi:acyl carrier protein